MKIIFAPYRDCLANKNNVMISVKKHLKSREIYEKYVFKIAEEYNSTCISRYLTFYCTRDEDVLAITRKIVTEKVINLKQFNFTF